MKELFEKFIEAELPSKYLLITCGLPSTLKTTVAREIVKIKGGHLLRSDLIRQEMLKNEDVFEEKTAADMDQRKLVYEEMFRQAEKALESGENVILDATFITQALRRQAAAIAARHIVPFIILQTECPQKIAVKRLLGRTRDNYESNALTEAAYLENKRLFEAVNLDELKNLYPDLSISHFIVDTTHNEPKGWYITYFSRFSPW